jgi:archaemetzincin
MNIRAILGTLIVAACIGCGGISETASNIAPAKDPRVESLNKQKTAVERFYKAMHVEEGDWVATQREPGETFEQYVASNPTLPTEERKTIYIQPIGAFTASQRNAIRLTAEYMRAFYNLPVKLNADRQLEKVPIDMQRRVEYKNIMQIRTSYFLDEVLPKLLPQDAAALIAFTNYDLYPQDTWAFVFGQASLDKRVGVGSLYRLSDLVLDKDDMFDRLLNRVLKIAMHETGHMFSMKHCTKYECLMSGTNHLAETDRRPLDNCPECMAKLAWAMKYDPVERYNNLAAFWRRHGRPDEEKRLVDMATAVGLAD